MHRQKPLPIRLPILKKPQWVIDHVIGPATPSLKRMIRRRYRDPNEQDEAFQLTQLHLIQKSHAFDTARSKEEQRRWILRVTKNFLSNRLRRRPPIQISLDQLKENGFEAKSRRAPPSDPAHATKIRAIYRKALRVMTPNQRAVFEYARRREYFSESWITMAARALGIQKGTVKSRSSEAYRIMRTEFRQNGFVLDLRQVPKKKKET